MKHFLAGLIIILSLCGCVKNFTPLANAYEVAYNESISYTYDDIDILARLIAEQKSIMDAAHQMAEAARQLGYLESHEVIILAQQEYQEAETAMLAYQAIYNNLMNHWHQKEEEYPVATYIWNYLKELGYNSKIRAGILGNIMAEVGGNTLLIDENLETETYYGMCQWSKKIYSDVCGASLEGQCNYLRDTIQYEVDTFGYKYKRNFAYSDFITLNDVKECALAFAKAYERCSSSSFYVRQENAIIAYNYFIGE